MAAPSTKNPAKKLRLTESALCCQQLHINVQRLTKRRLSTVGAVALEAVSASFEQIPTAKRHLSLKIDFSGERVDYDTFKNKQLCISILESRLEKESHRICLPLDGDLASIQKNFKQLLSAVFSKLHRRFRQLIIGGSCPKFDKRDQLIKAIIASLDAHPVKIRFRSLVLPMPNVAENNNEQMSERDFAFNRGVDLIRYFAGSLKKLALTLTEESEELNCQAAIEQCPKLRTLTVIGSVTHKTDHQLLVGLEKTMKQLRNFTYHIFPNTYRKQCLRENWLNNVLESNRSLKHLTLNQNFISTLLAPSSVAILERLTSLTYVDYRWNLMDNGEDCQNLLALDKSVPPSVQLTMTLRSVKEIMRTSERYKAYQMVEASTPVITYVRKDVGAEVRQLIDEMTTAQEKCDTEIDTKLQNLRWKGDKRVQDGDGK